VEEGELLDLGLADSKTFIGPLPVGNWKLFWEEERALATVVPCFA